MKMGDDFQKIGDLFGRNKTKKPPAFEWQELALRVVEELKIPDFKRSSIFKVCRDHSKEFIERCLADTKELCRSGERWRYFLKVVGGKSKMKNGGDLSP